MARDLSKEVSLLIERAMVASYILTHNGLLPPKQSLPSFSADQQERIERAIEFLEVIKP